MGVAAGYDGRVIGVGHGGNGTVVDAIADGGDGAGDGGTVVVGGTAAPLDPAGGVGYATVFVATATPTGATMSFEYESCRYFIGQLGVGCILIAAVQTIFLGGALPAALTLAAIGFVLALLGCFKPNREVNHV